MRGKENQPGKVRAQNAAHGVGGQIANTQSDQLTDIPATTSVEREDFQLSFQLRQGNGTEAGNVWGWENPNNNSER